MEKFFSKKQVLHLWQCHVSENMWHTFATLVGEVSTFVYSCHMISTVVFESLLGDLSFFVPRQIWVILGDFFIFFLSSEPISGEMKLVPVVCLALNAFQSDAASLRRSGRSKLTFIEVRGVFQTSHMAPRKRYVQTRVTISFCSKFAAAIFFGATSPVRSPSDVLFQSVW